MATSVGSTALSPLPQPPPSSVAPQLLLNPVASLLPALPLLLYRVSRQPLFSHFSLSKSSYLKFTSGPAAPMSVSLRSTDVTDTTATISWTVASIAYTPETYTVLYGTTRDNLDRTSGQQRTSGSDISVTSLPLSLPVSGLDPDSAYYYTVNASNSYSFTLYDTNTFNTSSRRESCDQLKSLISNKCM